MDRCTHHNCECHMRAAPASQTLEELRFLKSACSAAQKGDVKRLAELLAENPDCVGDDGVSSQSGYTPLLYAARSGHLNAVVMLIEAAIEICCEAGADVNTRTRAGKATPLHRAAYMGHTAIAEALYSTDQRTDASVRHMRRLHSGADASLQDADSKTPLDKAVARGHANMTELLQRHLQMTHC